MLILLNHRLSTLKGIMESSNHNFFHFIYEETKDQIAMLLPVLEAGHQAWESEQ